MGADIHVFAEQHLPSGWREVTDQDWTSQGLAPDEETPWPFYFGRHRNRGFWSILDRFWARRGLPRDVSEGIRERWEQADGAGEASWVSLQELIDFPWTQVTEYSGLVDASNFRKHQSGDPFSCYRQWLAGQSVAPHLPGRKIVSSREMAERIAAGDVPPNYYAWITFSTSCSPYDELVRKYTIPGLARWGDPQYVRVIFWFDY